MIVPPPLALEGWRMIPLDAIESSARYRTASLSICKSSAWNQVSLAGPPKICCFSNSEKGFGTFCSYQVFTVGKDALASNRRRQSHTRDMQDAAEGTAW